MVAINVKKAGFAVEWKDFKDVIECIQDLIKLIETKKGFG
jgi:hypothetical protein